MAGNVTKAWIFDKFWEMLGRLLTCFCEGSSMFFEGFWIPNYCIFGANAIQQVVFLGLFFGTQAASCNVYTIHKNPTFYLHTQFACM